MLWAVDPTHAMSHCSSTWEILSCMVHGVLDRLKSSWNDLHHSCNQLHDGMGMLRDLGSRTRLGSMVGLREAGLMEELERSHWGVEKSPSLEAVKPVLTKPDLMEGQAWSRDSREPPHPQLFWEGQLLSQFLWMLVPRSCPLSSVSLGFRVSQ